MGVGWKQRDIKNLPKTAQKQIGRLSPPITLTLITYGTPIAGHVTGTDQPTATAYPGNGVLTDYRIGEVDGTNILRGDRKVLVFAASLAAAAVTALEQAYTGLRATAGDKVTAEGVAYQIVNVVRDPAGASYELQVRW